MGRTIGAKNKVKKVVKQQVKTKQTQKQSQTVHVHLEKPKTRKKRGPNKPKELNNNPLSTSNISRSSSQNLGFHPRGLINNEPQQPTIINIQPTAQVEELERKLKKYKAKLNLQQPTPTPTPTIPQQQPINIYANPLPLTQPTTIQPTPVKPTVIKPAKLLKRLVTRNIKSRTKIGTLFKPKDLDETGSIHSSMGSYRAPSEAYEPPQVEEIEQMQTRSAKTAAERLAAHAKRQTEKEKKLENKLYSLKGSGSKPGSIQYHENQIMRLKAELETESKKGKRGQLQSRIEKLTKALDNLKEELPRVEEQLKLARESRTPVAKGRPPGIRGLVSSIFSPSK